MLYWAVIFLLTSNTSSFLFHIFIHALSMLLGSFFCTINWYVYPRVNITVYYQYIYNKLHYLVEAELLNLIFFFRMYNIFLTFCLFIYLLK